MTSDWFEDYAEDEGAAGIDEYDITSTPNDFNVLTLNSFVESGAVRIPGFQRNYVWDLQRASKLIESLILGLPVPQLFLYEQERNRFLVIDGQQRLMSIYYFIKQRFPRKEKRTELRSIFDEEGKIPLEVLHDDKYFQKFDLRLTDPLPDRRSRFRGLNYSTLGEYQTQFDLRPIRNIVVRQNSPSDDDSSMYEVFNRLNTGGTNLRPQEIRTSMYHSNFYDMLYHINSNSNWRDLLKRSEPDLHMKDIEILLRGFAMLVEGASYAPSMVKFLNQFSKKCARHTTEQNSYLKELFESFLNAFSDADDGIFINPKNSRFNVALYEAVFAAVCGEAFVNKREVVGNIDSESIRQLSQDPEFLRVTLEGTTRTSNVETRLRRARELVQCRQ